MRGLMAAARVRRFASQRLVLDKLGLDLEALTATLRGVKTRSGFAGSEYAAVTRIAAALDAALGEEPLADGASVVRRLSPAHMEAVVARVRAAMVPDPQWDALQAVFPELLAEQALPGDARSLFELLESLHAALAIARAGKAAAAPAAAAAATEGPEGEGGKAYGFGPQGGEVRPGQLLRLEHPPPDVKVRTLFFVFFFYLFFCR